MLEMLHTVSLDARDLITCTLVSIAKAWVRYKILSSDRSFLGTVFKSLHLYYVHKAKAQYRESERLT